MERVTGNSIRDIGRFADRLRRLPAIRKEKVARLRREISLGRYTVVDKIDVVIERILQELQRPA
jgi:anti-sigma28 factor (negative regulator of flagellin synthesis)